MTAIGQILNMSRDRVRTLEQKLFAHSVNADSELAVTSNYNRK